MTVLVTARFAIDPERLEAAARDNVESLQRIIARAREHGLISHRFYGNDDAVLVVDQWPDEQSFRTFFAASPDIAELMREAGATGEPQISYYRPLAVDDVVEPAATTA